MEIKNFFSFLVLIFLTTACGTKESIQNAPDLSVVANLVFTPNGDYDFGEVTPLSTVETTITVTNTGEPEATNITGTILNAGLPGPFQFKGGTYPGTGGDCSTKPCFTCKLYSSCNFYSNFRWCSN